MPFTYLKTVEIYSVSCPHSCQPGAEENTCTLEGGSGGRLENTA